MIRYRIISELGKGAAGVVYKAIRSDDSSPVALKKLVLPGHLDAKEEEAFINRFKSEAKAALDLKHPGIVGALDCGLDEGTFYIAYELVEGVTLEEAAKSGKKFSPEEVLDIIIQAAEALEYAHEHGVVHRDLSPGNIFLTNQGKVKITDFGVAAFTTHVTITSGDKSIVGTPGYMAPEQITSSEITPRADIFSLGCVGYELLSGEKAFTGDSIAQIIHRVINEQPRAIKEINPKIPLALEELVFRMLAKNPDYRYQSMAEVRSAASKVMEEIPRSRQAAVSEHIGHAPMLNVISGPMEGSKFDLQPIVTTIGRGIGDVLLDKDEAVSQQHAWITKEETGWVLYDADTEGGTFLNGEKIEREEILPGDRFQVGNTVIEFRGAGGHTGAFREDGTIYDPTKKAKESAKAASAASNKAKILPVLILAVPGILVVTAIILLALVFPHKYMSGLNTATDFRWDDSFRKLDSTEIATQSWQQQALEILDQWRANPMVAADSSGNTLSGPADLMAPIWVFNSKKINDAVVYRFSLFQLAEEFLVLATNQTSADMSAGGTANLISTPYQGVRTLQPRIESLEVPSGESAQWLARKNQLLSIVRRWLAAYTQGSPVGTGSTAFQAETDSAKTALLEGWYTYRDAGTDLNNLDIAFRKFQECIGYLDPVIQSNPQQEDVLAIRGLAAFLGAKVLRQAGDQLGPDRYQRALRFLDNAETDIGGVGQTAWDRAIPRDFTSDFPSPQSAIAQIRAVRSTVNNLLSAGVPASEQEQSQDQ